MNKSQLRNAMNKRLKLLAAADRELIEKKLTDNLITADLWKQASTIGITISCGIEWNTRDIIETAWREDKRVCVPKCNPETKELTFHTIHSCGQLETANYGLLEPKEADTTYTKKDIIDVLVVPGVVFDKQGYRIGFGGGYYDRYLEDFSNKTISIVSTMQVIDRVPAESFDIPVQYLVTENGLLHE